MARAAVTETTDIDTTVRRRIRSLRIARGFSLDEMAQRSGVNASTMSRIETGDRRLALDLLAPIAKALDVSLDELVDTSSGDVDVVIRPKRCEEHGIVRWQLSRETGPNGTNVVKMRLDPLPEPPALQVHPGRDWVYVLSGTVKLLLGDREILVHAGQAADFPTMTPHAFTAHVKPAELISIFDHAGQHAHLKPDAARRRVR
jgi:transcriptional regulator with XRE-family HTH domain